MTPNHPLLSRLQFLARIVQKECQHLQATDQRLFATPFTKETAVRLNTDIELAERVEAFVGRFGRLQDTLGDKLLPQLLSALGEKPGAFIDNLNRAERLGWIDSTDQWLTLRQLRNQMVHEYIEDPIILANALQAGHDFVGHLVSTSHALLSELLNRGWAETR